MKKLSLFLVLMILTIFIPDVKAQKWVIFSDSISNSQTEVFDLDLHKYPGLDSIVLGWYASGEIDVDSVGISVYLNLKNDGNTIQDEDALTGVTMTTNLDSGVTTRTAVIATITGAQLRGQDTARFKVISAASGNVATDPAQRYYLIARIYE